MFYPIGAINSFKLRDGIDGLAAGLAVIAACFFGVIFYLQDNLFGLLIASFVVGSTMVFLYYNFSPAQILLGSNGSYLLGLLLGVVGRTEFTVKTFIVPLVILAIPILVTSSVLIQSLVKRQSIFFGTRGHIYNNLINNNITLNRIVTLFYGVGIVLGVFAIWLFLVFS